MKTADPDFVATNGVQMWKLPDPQAIDPPRLDAKGHPMVFDEDAYQRAVNTGLGLALLPPLAFLLIGSALVWAFSGFSRRR